MRAEDGKSEFILFKSSRLAMVHGTLTIGGSRRLSAVYAFPMNKVSLGSSFWRRILQLLKNLWADGGPLAPGWGFGRRKS